MAEIEKSELATIKYSQGLASKVIGAIVGGGTSLLTANPVLGAVVGASVAHTLESVGKEVIERHLTARQEIRVGRTIAIAYGKLAEMELQGRPVRQDGFFGSGVSGRSAGDEITEATLYAAMNSVEEKKIDFLATLLANLATTTEVDEATAHLLIDLAERLGFRAFVILNIISDGKSHGFTRRELGQDAASENLDVSLEGLELEIFNLSQNGLALMKDDETDADSFAVLGPNDIDPGRMYLSPMGQLLHDSLGLDGLDEGPIFQLTLSQMHRLANRIVGSSVIDGGTA